MLCLEQVQEILEQARLIDPGCEMFGAKRHRYRLNPPIREELVRGIEEEYGFTLPEDYRRFITRIGDGGAGPDYGIEPFGAFRDRGAPPDDHSAWAVKNRAEYRRSLLLPFAPRPMAREDLEEYAIARAEVYEAHPDRYFILEPPEEGDDPWSTRGFLELGTHGCQWDFGVILNGEMRGWVFTTDNVGAYSLEGRSFEEFYQSWLDRLADADGYRRALEEWKSHFAK